MSVSVHGVQALFVKPAQSLAPIIGLAFLPAGALKTNLADMTPRQVRVRRARVFVFFVMRFLCPFSRGSDNGSARDTGDVSVQATMYVQSESRRK